MSKLRKEIQEILSPYNDLYDDVKEITLRAKILHDKLHLLRHKLLEIILKDFENEISKRSSSPSDVDLPCIGDDELSSNPMLRE